MKRKIRGVGQTLKSKLPTSTEDKERLKRACSTAVGALHTTLSIVKDVAGNTGPPGLQAGIAGLILILDVVQKMSQNAQDVEQLGMRIDDLMVLLQNAKDRGTLSETIIGRIDRLSAKWTSVIDEVQKIASRPFFERMFRYSDDAQSINDYIKTITWSMESFNVESTLAIEFTLDRQTYAVRRIEGKLDDVAKKVDHVAQKVDSGVQQLNARLDVKDGHPPHAVFAQFNCKVRARCLEGTRSDILEQVDHWIDAGDVPLVGNTEPAPRNLPIFWINGSAGTGKTTIASTVAETCSKRQILGASFFCCRDNAECSNPNLIFPTIAYQLGLFSPLFQEKVTLALKANPDIGYCDVPYQLEELIVKPLHAVRTLFPSCVIVLDALDECKDGGATSIILSSLARHVGELSPLKIFVTSRPERNITLAFSNQLGPATQRLVLHEAELEVVQNDIEHYLTSSLALVSNAYQLDPSWPSMEDIHALTLLSVGLFIFASTSVKFIEDRNYCNPRVQLSELLRNKTEVVNSPYHHLDQLYMEVLTHAFPDLSSALAGLLKMVLGTIVLLRDPLSLIALERLLNLREGTVRETLVYLHSVVIVPDDDDQVIRLHHPSFFDFMTSPTRCLNPKLVVNARTQHTLLARECLNVMKDLRRDICGINNPSILNNEVDDLQTRITRYIPAQLQYACRHWAFHLTKGMLSDVLLDLVKEFSSKYLLYWVEVCSLLGELRGALLALDFVQKALARVGNDMTDAITLLHDCERFTRQFFSVISTSSLQVYHSALLFAPEETIIYKTYQRELLLPMKVYNASEKTWDSCMRTMDGPFGPVKAVAFSPDGARVVSGSFDHTVRLWDAVSGTHLNTLKGHSSWVKSVAFSPDGFHVVSGSLDKSVRLWDVVSGTHLNTLKGHSHWVLSVGFSPDGSRVVSASFDRTVRLWDTVSGTHLKTFNGHSGPVNSAAFSPDGTRVVSGSDDSTLRLWDAVNSTHLNTFKGPSACVQSVAFSPGGTRVVSGSDDGTIRLWDTVSGIHLHTLEGHSQSVLSVGFSPDGTRIVSGSSDTTLRLWDAISCTQLKTLEGHAGHVLSTAFSPDGTRVVSGSEDRTVRLWDAVRGTQFNTLNRHSGSVRSVVFSPDGDRVMSGSEDKTVRLWDAVGGTQFNTLGGHSGSVLSVVFSPDGNRVVSASADRTLQLWNAISGTHLNALVGHYNIVFSVAFSPDGTRVVSGSGDNTLRLWDGVDGTHLDTLTGHSSSVYSVAFSPDGTRVVSGSDDNTVRLWGVFSGTHLRRHTLKGHLDYVLSVVFSADGTRVASGSGDNSIRLWDAVSGTHLNTLRGHSSGVRSVAFSTDGSRVVSGSDDGTLRLWDAIKGVRLDTLEAHSFSVASVAYSLTSSQSSLSQSHPVASSAARPISSYFIKDGWVYSLPQKRRLCWIPVSCRPREPENCLVCNGSRIALGSEDGRVVMLDFAGMDSYLNTL